MRRKSRTRLAAVPVAAALVLVVGLVFWLDPFGRRDVMAQEEFQTPSSAVTLDLPAWMAFELEDAVTGEIFRIRDLVGKPILLESFAVWCPICTSQQKQLAQLKSQVEDRVVLIGLDTDPNEDLEKVREHALRGGFDWYYAVSPIGLTQLLIEAFGLTVVNAPRAPVILIEPDGSTRLLESGVKSAERLLEVTGLEPIVEGADS